MTMPRRMVIIVATTLRLVLGTGGQCLLRTSVAGGRRVSTRTSARCSAATAISFAAAHRTFAPWFSSRHNCSNFFFNLNPKRLTHRTFHKHFYDRYYRHDFLDDVTLGHDNFVQFLNHLDAIFGFTKRKSSLAITTYWFHHRMLQVGGLLFASRRLHLGRFGGLVRLVHL